MNWLLIVIFTTTGNIHTQILPNQPACLTVREELIIVPNVITKCIPFDSTTCRKGYRYSGKECIK